MWPINAPVFSSDLPFPITRSRSRSLREERTLTACGISNFESAVCGYLYGCRAEANALVAKGYEMLTLADTIAEKSAGDYGSSWGRARRYTALAYLHCLKTGEEHERARAEARKAILSHGRRSKHFDRASANLEAPQLLYLEAYPEIISLWDRLSREKGRLSARAGGLFGDALQIATAVDPAERERLKAKLRKRIPLHMFRWMSHGNYSDVCAFASCPLPATRWAASWADRKRRGITFPRSSAFRATRLGTSNESDTVPGAAGRKAILSCQFPMMPTQELLAICCQIAYRETPPPGWP